MDKEKRYILKRCIKGKIQSIPFYLCRVFRIDRKKIVFCCLEGTAGYSCNPKYIAEELIKRKGRCRLVWLVDDVSKKFPPQVSVVKNTLWNRAYQLSTAKVWVDNSRKQLEVRKRKGQVYIQTWHANLGVKPIGLDRGKAFSKMAYIVSRHDSDMIDYVLSDSEWYDNMIPTGLLYKGPTLRVGSPRCDVLVNRTDEMRAQIRRGYGLPEDARIIMYAPTFRGGSQETVREITTGKESLDYSRLVQSCEARFGGSWYVMLRFHPQLVARGIRGGAGNKRLVNISGADDMYEILAGCDAFITDYSSAAFDAMVMKIPVFLYCDDYIEYQKERGELLWKLEELPFPLAKDNEEMQRVVEQFWQAGYFDGVDRLVKDTQLSEDGQASKRVADYIIGRCL